MQDLVPPNELYRQFTDETGLVIMCAYEDTTIRMINSPHSYKGADLILPSNQNITVYAENLFLQRGQTYKFPSRTLKFLCKKLCFVGESGEVTFDLSGKAGNPGTPGADGYDFRGEFGNKNGTEAHPDGKDGKPEEKDERRHGHPGKSGDHGDGYGGIFSLYAESIDSTSTCKIQINARGGDGGAGGKGGDGSQAEKGGNGLEELRSRDAPWVVIRRAGNGGYGGCGGNAGNGGDGGDGVHGGTVLLNFFSPIEEIKKINVDIEGGAKGDKGLPGKKSEGNHGGISGKSAHQTAKDGKPGKNGLSGIPGRDGHDGGQGSFLPLCVATLDKEKPNKEEAYTAEEKTKYTKNYVAAHNFFHLSMILERVRFTYLTSYSSDKKNKALESINNTLEWLGKIFSTRRVDSTVLKSTIGDDAYLEFTAAQGTYHSFMHLLINKLDYYGHTFDTLPQLNWNFDDFSRQVDDFTAFEEFYLKHILRYASYKDAIEQVKKRYAKDKTQLENINRKIKDTSALLESLRAAINTKMDGVLVLRETMNKAVKGIEEEIQHTIGCKATDVVAALGNVVMMSSSEWSKANFIGGLASMASTFHFDTIDTGPGRDVSKSYLTRSITCITDESNDLLKNFKAAWKPNGEGAVGAPFAQMIAVEAQQFQSLYSTYLAELDPDGKLKETFQAYFSGVQELNNLAVKFNETVLQLYNLQLKKQKLEQQQAKLEEKGVLLNNPDIQVLTDFYVTLYRHHREVMMYNFYSINRSVQCLSLEEDDSLKGVSGLGSIAVLDAGAFHSCLMDLKGKIQNYENGLSLKHRVGPEDIQCTLSQSEYPHLFESLKSGKGFSHSFHQEDLGFVKGHENIPRADVRLHNVRVHLVGAVSHDNNNSISLDIKQGMVCWIPDVTKKQENSKNTPLLHKFNVLNRKGALHIDYPYSYSYDPAHPEDEIAYKDIDPHYDEKGKISEFVIDPKTGKSFPLLSPFSNWTVSLAGRNIDLTHVERIIFKFSVYYCDFGVSILNDSIFFPLQISPQFWRALKFNVPLARGYSIYKYYNPVSRFIPDTRLAAHFDSYGNNYGRMPGLFLQDFNKDEFLDRLLKSGQDTYENWASQERGDFVFSSRKDSEEGHFATVGTVVEYSGGRKPAEMIGSYDLIKHCAKTMPGTFFLDEAMAKDFLASADRQKFLESHREAIEKRSVEIHKDGKTLTGKYLLLGSANLVKCHFHTIKVVDGRTLQAALMGTTSIHTLDGNVPWVFVHDPKYPEHIGCVSIHAGKNNVPFGDRFNNLLAPAIFGHFFHVTPTLAEVGESKLSEALWEKNKSLWMGHNILLLSGGAALLGSSMRECFGPNYTAETVGAEVLDLSPENFATVKGSQTPGLPGIEVEGKRFSYLSAVCDQDLTDPRYDLFSKIGENELAEIEKLVKEKIEDTLSEATLDAIEKEIERLAKDIDYLSNSSEKILSEIFSSERRASLEKYIEKLIYEPIQDDLLDALDKDPKLSELIKDHVVKNSIYRVAKDVCFKKNFSDPIFDVGGLAEAKINIDVITKKKASIQEALEKNRAMQQEKNEEIKKLNEEKERETDKKRLEAIKTKIREQEAKMKEITQAGKELEEIKDNKKYEEKRGRYEEEHKRATEHFRGKERRSRRTNSGNIEFFSSEASLLNPVEKILKKAERHFLKTQWGDTLIILVYRSEAHVNKCLSRLREQGIGFMKQIEEALKEQINKLSGITSHYVVLLEEQYNSALVANSNNEVVGKQARATF